MKRLIPLLLLSTCLQAQDTSRWAFAPAPDDFKPDALLDLRSLNEEVAGKTGFVHTDGEGGFLLGDGTPVRFWAVGSFTLMNRPWKPRPLWPDEKAAPNLEHHARFLAKHGVNLVRLHCALNPDAKKNPGAKLEDFSEDIRDYIWENVAAMKKAGIYTMVTPYWAAAFRPSPAMGFGTDNAHGLLFFDPRLQNAYKHWLHELLVPANPYTGIPLARDPAFAILQIQNEDSTLFWTISGLKGQELALLTDQYSGWLVKKYGSAPDVLKAWDHAKSKNDDEAAGRFELLHIYEMTLDNAKGGRAKRLADQLQFWSELMFNFHRDIVDFLRKECGCRQLISAGNWHTADVVRLNDALRWTYTATDIQGVNRYFPGHHEGDMSGWNIKPGHIYNSRSFLTNPFDWPLQLKLPIKQPFIITESSWTFPSATASEGPLLTAAYQSLTGFNALCWFAFDTEQWTPPRSANGFMPDTMQKFVAAYPDCLGQFPAAALIFRKGYVKQSAPVIQEVRSLDDIWQRRKPVAAETGSYDSRKERPGPQAPAAVADPRAFFVGPVRVEYGASGKSTVADISPYIDEKENSIRSNTGELALNLDKASWTLNTRCAQGVAAFFKNQRDFALESVKIHSDNDYGVCVVVSMDGKPLRESSEILIQAGTNALPAGWAESPAPAETGKPKKGAPPSEPPPADLMRIDKVGHAPWMVERGKFTIALANSKISQAVAVDPNGYARGAVEFQRANDQLTFHMPEDALYVILR